jgi:hypothetical protein
VSLPRSILEFAAEGDHGGELQLNSKLHESTEAIAIFPASRVMEAVTAVPTKEAQQREGLPLSYFGSAASIPERMSAAALTVPAASAAPVPSPSPIPRSKSGIRPIFSAS